MPKQKAFDGPVKIVTHLDLASLRMMLANEAPLGSSRPQSIRSNKRRGQFGTPKTYTYRVKPPAPGRLRQSFMKAGAVTLSESGKSILIKSDLPYARAVDQGRKAVTIRPRNAEHLMFKVGGRVVFTKEVHQPARKGQFFVKRAVMKWWGKRGKEIQVRWAKHESERAVTAS